MPAIHTLMRPMRLLSCQTPCSCHINSYDPNFILVHNTHSHPTSTQITACKCCYARNEAYLPELGEGWPAEDALPLLAVVLIVGRRGAVPIALGGLDPWGEDSCKFKDKWMHCVKRILSAICVRVLLQDVDDIMTMPLPVQRYGFAVLISCLHPFTRYKQLACATVWICSPHFLFACTRYKQRQ